MNVNSFLLRMFPSPNLVNRADASKEIIKEIESPRPSMIARFGAVEIKAALYPLIPSVLREFQKNSIFNSMEVNAGFFPASSDSIRRFSELMLEDTKQVNILGSWRIEERLFGERLNSALRVELRALEPYLSNNPWSESLAGKRVLVVHPFARSIEEQYERRELIFEDKRVLPSFRTLQTVKAVQTVARTSSEFSDWFAALESMKVEIGKRDFDVAIIGCGAYGFPLAAYVKRLGKKAVHMGGATQLLFGIKGRRWDNHPIISRFYNENWVRPSISDVPANANRVEDACYW